MAIAEGSKRVSDYRYQITIHNDIPCLHVMIEAHDAGVVLPSVQDGIAHCYIPVDDIQKSLNAHGISGLSTAIMQANRALGEMIRGDKIDLGSIVSHIGSIGDAYNEHFPVTHINVIKEDRNIEDYRPGDMGKTSHYNGAWTLCCPRGCGMVASLTNQHVVTEHEDGTISVTSSLFHGCIDFAGVRFRIDHNQIVYINEEERGGDAK